MSSRSEPTNPTTGPGANAPCDATTSPCPSQPKECPQVEIEINNTPATNDDLVQLKGERPVERYKVPCRIRATGGGSGTPPIVLTNPDGRLRFPDAGDTTKTLSVPLSGAWVNFEISGELASNALNDAVIEAHCQTATGALKGSKTVTVFWFDEAKMDILNPGSYRLIGNTFTATGGNTVNYSAKARIRPAGVACGVAQVRDLRIGIMQNDATNGLAAERVYSNPRVTWNPGVPAGTRVIADQSISIRNSIPGIVNDTDALANPLYDQPGLAVTLDPNSLKPPIGCTNGGSATSFDTPSSTAPAILVRTAIDTAGHTVGVLTYTRMNMRIIATFITWTVVFNTRTNKFNLLRERNWRLNVQSVTAGTQKATVAANDSAPTTNAVLSPFANDVVNDPANRTTVTTGTVNFNK